MRWVASSGWCDRTVPTYELRCEECGNRFERFLQRLLAESDRVCPRCGSVRVKPGVGGGYVAGPARSETPCAPRGGFA